MHIDFSSGFHLGIYAADQFDMCTFSIIHQRKSLVKDRTEKHMTWKTMLSIFCPELPIAAALLFLIWISQYVEWL